MERYALFDWDGTLREGYTLFEWIGFLRERGEIHSARVLKRHDRLVADYREGRISHDVLARGCQNGSLRRGGTADRSHRLDAPGRHGDQS